MRNIRKLSLFNKINEGDNHDLGKKEMMLIDEKYWQIISL